MKFKRGAKNAGNNHIKKNLISVVAAAILALASTVAPAEAGEIIVKVSGRKSTAGEIGCALFSGNEGFSRN